MGALGGVSGHLGGLLALGCSFLVASWELLGLPKRHRLSSRRFGGPDGGNVLGHLGGVLGLPGSFLDASWRLLKLPKRKTLVFSRILGPQRRHGQRTKIIVSWESETKELASRDSWKLLGLPERQTIIFSKIWGPRRLLGHFLEVCWGLLGTSWGVLGMS